MARDMTDIKAFELIDKLNEAYNAYYDTTQGMPYDIDVTLRESAICLENLFNANKRQKAEIERLLQKLQQPHVEVIKEFADLSIKNICKNVTPIPQQKYLINMCIKEIEKTKKEMVGES